MLTDPNLQLYISQPIEKGQDSKDLIIENPTFVPFSYKLEGIAGRIDENRTRYQFESAFRDLAKDSEGRISTMVVFNEKSEAYFESFTVHMTRPVDKTIRILDGEIEDTGEDLSKLRPRRSFQPKQPRPQELDGKFRF